MEKIQKSILTNLIPIPFYIKNRKNWVFTFLRGFSFGARNLKKLSDPFICEKKFVRIIGVMVFKSTGSDSRFQRNNWFWKKLSKIDLPNKTSKIGHILADISVFVAYFSKPIFPLQPWVLAGRFEYHEPYNPNNLFFTHNGVRHLFELPLRVSFLWNLDNFRFIILLPLWAPLETYWY